LTEHLSEQSYAGFWRRGAAFWVDNAAYQLITTIPCVGVSYLATTCAMAFPRYAELATLLDILLQTGLSLLGYFVYFAWFDVWRKGITPGRQITGIVLLSEDGDHVSLRQSIIRQLGKIVSMLVLGLGYKWQPFTAKKQAWHDSWSQTIVARTDQSNPVSAGRIIGINVAGIVLSVVYVGWIVWQEVSKYSFSP
jgi:uncharacterized RDD family membrane protein YckC